MPSAGSSRVHSVGSRDYSPFLEESSWTASDQDLIAGWGVCGAWMPGYWPLVGPPFTTSYFRGVLERVLKLSPGQMAIP
jgi:hypothetical protein